MAEALERLRDGMPVLIFPEGTRSPEGGLRAFKRGAFEIAYRAGVPIVPLFIRCQPPVLSKEAPWYRAPRIPPRYTITRLVPSAGEAWSGDAWQVAAAVKQSMQRCLDDDAATPAERGCRDVAPRVPGASMSRSVG